MKRTLCCLLLLLLAVTGTAAGEGAYGALKTQYDDILRREEAIALELQIIDLQLQLARLNEDNAALAASQAQADVLEAELITLAETKKTLAGQLVPAISQEQIRLEQEEAALNSQLDAAKAALTDNKNQQDTLEDLHESCMRLAGQVASAKGFAADVTVFVLLDESNAVVDLLVDAPWETPGLGARCEDDAFTRQFIGKTGPFILGSGVDAVSGATITSRAVVDAVNSLFPAKEGVTVSARGLLSDVVVTVSLDESGLITDILVDCSGETQSIAAPCAEAEFLSQFIGQAGPFTPGVNVDVVAGATYTSKAVINAVNTLFEEGAEAQ